MRLIPHLIAAAIVSSSLLVAGSPNRQGASNPPPAREGALNATYRLGTEPGAALDLSVQSVEYKATREKVGPFNVWPDADHKLLVVHRIVS